MFVFVLLVWLVFFAIFESDFLRLSMAAERWLVFVTLILPAVVGIVLGGVGVFKARQKKTWALFGLLLNTLVVVFFSGILFVAGEPMRLCPEGGV